VSARTQLINSVRGWLRAEAATVSTGAPETFADRVRKLAARRRMTLPPCVVRQLVVIGDLTLQIEEADEELEGLADKDPICERLMTVPGIGPVNAVLYRALLDEIERFPSAHSVQSYLGLTPGEDSSSSKTRRTGISKAGSPRMRRLLTQAAWCARRCRKNDPMVQWSFEVQKRRGKRVAVIALARKLAGVLFAIWRDGSTYQPHKGARPSVPEDPATKMEAALALLKAG
jgi:transposase